MGKISVIVPIYNSEKYLNRCLDSLVNQTYKDIEIILVDDGSTDKSLQICMEYKDKDSRIIVIHKCNGGLSSARNIAIDSAKGDYITFVDSDDFVSLHYIEILYELAVHYDADITMTHFVRGCEDKFEFKKVKGKVSKYTNIEFIEKRLIKGDSQSACCKLYKRTIFNTLRFPEGIIWEDLAISAALFYEAKTIVEIKNPLYYYFQNPNGIIHSKFDIDKLQAISAYEKRLNFLKQKKMSGAYRRFMRQYMAILFQYYYRVKRYLRSEKIILQDIYSKIKSSYEEIKKYNDISVIIKLILRIGIIFPYGVGMVLNSII